MKRFVLWIGVIIGLLVIATAFRQCRQRDAADYQTATITRGPVTQAVTATGTLNPVVNVQVGSQVSGNIAKLFVDFNSEVRAGQVVAQIDPALFQATVTQAEGDLANAQAALELAKVNAARTQELFTRRTSSQADLDQAMANLHQSEATVRIKQGALDKARADLEATQQQIISLLRQRHNIRPGRDDDFTVRNQQEIAQAATATSRVMTLLLGAIAGVSLVVGGIGIMNIMLVSVTERTRDIGVRMAVGAHGSDILTQFLVEAVTLSSVGGLIGIVCGIGASKILSAYANWPTLISISSIAIAFLFSAAVGIFFGFYPARKDAALDPIEALRYE